MNATEVTFLILLGLIVHTYLLYPLILVIASSAVKQEYKETYMESALPSVTMVVSAFNEQEIIQQKLENCLSLDYPPAKMTFSIGSDGSTDGTNEILLSVAKNGQIRSHIFHERKGKASVINRLVEMSSSEIIVFSDANTLYDRNAIRLLVRHFEKSRVGVVSGRLIFTAEASQTAERQYWAIESHIRYLEGKLGLPLGANGAVYAIRRSLFVPFPENRPIADDFILPLKIYGMGHTFVYDREARAFEQANDLREEFRRRVRIGAQNFSGISEIASFLNPFAGGIAFALWSHKIIRWMVPFLMIAVFILNYYLTTIHQMYLYSFWFQVLTYVTAFFTYVYRENSWKFKVLWYPTYFVVMNLALLMGFMNYILGKQQSSWQARR